MDGRRWGNIWGSPRKARPTEDYCTNKVFTWIEDELSMATFPESARRVKVVPCCAFLPPVDHEKEGCRSIPLRRNYFYDFVPDLAKRASIDSNGKG